MPQQRCLGALTINRERSARRRLALATAGMTVAIAMVPASAGAVRPGNLLAWGSNNAYTLGDGSGTVQSEPVRTRLLPGVKVVGVSGGFADHTLAATNGGGLLGWGANWYGKLGDKEQDWHTRHPVAGDLAVLDADEYITAVSAGYNHGIALTSDDRVVAFGRSREGLARGGRDGEPLGRCRSRPRRVPAPSCSQRGALRVEIAPAPVRDHVRRGGRRLVRGLGVWAARARCTTCSSSSPRASSPARSSGCPSASSRRASPSRSPTASRSPCAATAGGAGGCA